MSVQIQLRRDTAANWTSVNPTLATGEVGLETDTKKLKVGDGATAWTSLVYYQTVAPQVTFSMPGTLAVKVGAHRWYNDSGYTLTFVKARVSAGTAPTGAAILVDINKGGTTVFTTQSNRPTIAISGFTGTTTTFDVATIADGEYLTIDVDQVGSTILGADLTVQVQMRL